MPDPKDAASWADSVTAPERLDTQEGSPGRDSDGGFDRRRIDECRHDSSHSQEREGAPAALAVILEEMEAVARVAGDGADRVKVKNLESCRDKNRRVDPKTVVTPSSSRLEEGQK
jgi:hypothetical protein